MIPSVMPRKFVDITGKRFGRWTVLALHSKRYRSGHNHCLALWLCRCRCGTQRVVIGTNLRTGASRSCGCLRREKFHNKKHGHAHVGKRSRVYGIWANMLQRCNNPNSTSYDYYGGAGVYVVDDWHDFVNWYADTCSEGEPTPDLSLDRIDPYGPYAPWNFRWADRGVQAANKRRHHRKKRSRK